MPLGLRIPADLAIWLVNRAGVERESVNTIVVTAIEQYRATVSNSKQ